MEIDLLGIYSNIIIVGLFYRHYLTIYINEKILVQNYYLNM